jgi:RNA polymerase sigma-70 factor (ECF subfamily)
MDRRSNHHPEQSQRPATNGSYCNPVPSTPRTAASTDWRQIAALYTRLLGIQPSAVVELNRVVAIAMRDGPEKGRRLIEDLLERNELADYYLAYSARAELCRKLGRLAEARASYEKALGPGPAGA